MSKYKINSEDDYVCDADTILDALSSCNVLDIEKLEDGKYRLWEGCDSYYFIDLTKEEIKDLGQELIKMVTEDE